VLGSTLLPLHITKDAISTPGTLNSQCGADYVKTQQRAPPGVELVAGQRYCSYDGDADRIVFYYADEQATFHLLDGDKIAGLAAGFIIELVKQAGLDIEVGVVQTAYANGASTDYLVNVLVRPPSFIPSLNNQLAYHPYPHRKSPSRACRRA
jgi:phosphoacetylglucosamine mutase